MENRTLKTNNKLEVMKSGGAKLASIRKKLIAAVKPGITCRFLEDYAGKLINYSGGQSSFRMVTGYDYVSCINLNEGVVHGIPKEKKIKNGDLVSLDIGLYYKGFHTDAATTDIAGKGSKEDVKFLQVGKSALAKAIKQARFGNRVVDISRAIQTTVQEAGFTCIRSLTGHGVGKKLHEDPPIPCFVQPGSQVSPLLKIGQSLAIEVIYTQGEDALRLEADGWTLSTKDGRKAALFEETILITKGEPIIITA